MRDDLRAAFRSLRGAPGFTAVAVGVLTLGIGAAVAIFSVVDAIVLRGLPFDEHDRLAVVLEHDTKRPITFGNGTTTTQTFLDWRARQRSFERLSAVGGTSFSVKGESGEPVAVPAQRVSHELFDTLRVRPFMGRTFTLEEESDGRHRVVILSHGYWLRQFGGAPDVIGRTIEMSDDTWEIVGVMPRGFTYPVGEIKPTEMYTPLRLTDSDRTRANSGRNFNWLAIGRLKPAVSAAQAQDDMSRVMAGIDAEHPRWMDGRRARVASLHHHLVGRVRGWMLVLLGAVLLVLLIACANVANLMLARATVRAREMGIRAALGAGRWRLTRALLIEGLMLSAAGTLLGVGLAAFGVQLLTAWLPSNLPRVAAVGLDLRVLTAAALAAVATGVSFSILPALQASRPDVVNALRDGGRSMTAGKAGRVRSMLVVTEVALAVLLVVGAGLFTASFVQLMRVDPGFDYRNVVVLNAGVRTDPKAFLPGTPQDVTRRLMDEARARGAVFFRDVIPAVKAVPGVEALAFVTGGVPLTGSWSRGSVRLVGRPAPSQDDASLDTRRVSPGYLELLRVPLRDGRYLNEGDGPGSEQVVVVNETAARLYWPGERAVGQRINFAGADRVVVGVVGDLRHLGPEAPLRQEAYVPLELGSFATMMVRTSRDPLDVLPLVKDAIRSVKKDHAFNGDIFTLEGYLDRMVAQRRFSMALLGLLGVLGLVIAAAGVYGVMAYVVSQRTQEIGLRMALGARPGNVVAMVMRNAAVLIGIGVIAGTAAAWYLSASVQSFLFLVASNDLRVFSLAIAVLVLAGLAACALPARRASKVDPIIALRS